LFKTKTRVGEKVAVKITLAMYGAVQEVAMLKKCQGKGVVKLLWSGGDGVLAIVVMEVGGTAW
jgi:hypothetical protein